MIVPMPSVTMKALTRDRTMIRPISAPAVAPRTSVTPNETPQARPWTLIIDTMIAAHSWVAALMERSNSPRPRGTVRPTASTRSGAAIVAVDFRFSRLRKASGFRAPKIAMSSSRPRTRPNLDKNRETAPPSPCLTTRVAAQRLRARSALPAWCSRHRCDWQTCSLGASFPTIRWAERPLARGRETAQGGAAQVANLLY